MSSDTDMSIQLFMQSTIMLSNYYGFQTVRYSEIRERAARAGYSMIPFMPPETVRATPELVGFLNKYEDNDVGLQDFLRSIGGYENLVKYYIRTGLRASQAICRNYLLNLEERNEYLEFLQKEIGVAAALSTAVLTLVNANATLAKSFLVARTGIDGGIDAYQEYRFLNVDREAARGVVEAAQNALASYFLKQVDATLTNRNLTAGGFTFSDALHAVSVIEYQCTRSGIRNLLTRSINNTPANLIVDPETGTITFRSTVNAPVDPTGPGAIVSGGQSGPAPLGTGNTASRTKPPAQSSSSGEPSSSGQSGAAKPNPGTITALETCTGPADAASLIQFLCPSGLLRTSRRAQLVGLQADLVNALATDTALTVTPDEQKKLITTAGKLSSRLEVIIFKDSEANSVLRKKLAVILDSALKQGLQPAD